MEKKNDKSSAIGRRVALHVLGVGFGAATGVVVLGGCTKGGDQASKGGAGGGSGPAGGSCQAMVEVDETAQQLRRTLQYKEKSDDPNKKCSICAQFESARYGNGCGGCKLFAGAVNVNGACLSFAPLLPPGTPAAAPGAVPAGTAPAAPPPPAAPPTPAAPS